MPRPRNQGRATKADRKAARATMKRLFHDIFTTYPIHLILVVIFIIVSVLANVQGTLFTRTLIDSYITPPALGDRAGACGAVALAQSAAGED